MDQIKTVEAWLVDAESGITQFDPSVMDQIAALEKANTGIGFVFVLSPVSQETTGNPDVRIEDEVDSYAVFKVRGKWYVVLDENISDIATAIVRIITADIEK